MSNERMYQIKMSDGSVWQVPVSFIAKNNSQHVGEDFKSEEEIYNCAVGMSWRKVEDVAVCVKQPLEKPTYSNDWALCEDFEIIYPTSKK